MYNVFPQSPCSRIDKVVSQNFRFQEETLPKTQITSINHEKFNPFYTHDLSQGSLTYDQKNLVSSRLVDALDQALSRCDPQYETSLFMRGALNQLVQLISSQFLKDFASGHTVDSLLIPILLYTEKYLSKTQCLEQTELFELLLAVCLITHKFWSDRCPSPKKIAKLGGIELKDLLEKELQVLSVIGFELFLPETVLSETIMTSHP